VGIDVVYAALALASVTTLCAAFLLTRSRRPKQRPDAATPRTLHRLVDDLRRIEHEYIRVERSNSPAKAARLRALNLAYDDTLRECCLALGLPEPGERPLSGLVRLQTEAELVQHGLMW